MTSPSIRSLTEKDQLLQDALVERGRAMAKGVQRRAKLSFTGDRRRDFYEDLAEMIRPDRDTRLHHALAFIWLNQTSRGTKRLDAPFRAPLAIIIPVVLYRMHELGQPWHEAMQDYLPADDHMVLSAVPAAGLDSNLLNHMAEATANSNKEKWQALNAFVPLAVALFTFIGLLYGAGSYYFPKLIKSVPHYVPQGTVKTIYSLSLGTLHYGHFAIAVLLALPFAVAYFAPRMTGEMRRVIDQWPVVSLYKEITGVKFFRTLSSLLRANVRLPDALELLAENSTPYVRERIMPAIYADDLSLGDSFEASDFHWPTDHLIRKVGLFMSGSNPEDGLLRLADHATERLRRRLDTFRFLTNVFGMVMISVLVLLIYYETDEITRQAKAAAQARQTSPNIHLNIN